MTMEPAKWKPAKMTDNGAPPHLSIQKPKPMHRKVLIYFAALAHPSAYWVDTDEVGDSNLVRRHEHTIKGRNEKRTKVANWELLMCVSLMIVVFRALRQARWSPGSDRNAEGHSHDQALGVRM